MKVKYFMNKITSAQQAEKELLEYLGNKNYSLIGKYINNKTPLTIICNKGHTTHPIWSNIKRRNWSCYLCSHKTYRYTLEDAKNIAISNNGKLISTTFINSKKALEWECKNNHRFSKSLALITNYGSWCNECSSKYNSEEICRSVIEHIFNAKFPKYKANWLINSKNNKIELDGYCESLGIAFEHHGEYHFKPIDFLIKTKA